MTVHLIIRSVLSAAVAVVLLAGHATAGSAQSLGDVARREAERRQQVAGGKVYTNGDLGPVDGTTPPPQPPVQQSPASGAETPETQPSSSQAPPGDNPGKEPVIAKGREKRDEQYWRKLVKDLRARVERANANVAAQEARLAELDGGPPSPASVREREVVVETLSRAQRDARSLSNELTRFLTRAQVDKVPAEWIQ
jgi:hypothetical protein